MPWKNGRRTWARSQTTTHTSMICRRNLGVRAPPSFPPPINCLSPSPLLTPGQAMSYSVSAKPLSNFLCFSCFLQSLMLACHGPRNAVLCTGGLRGGPSNPLGCCMLAFSCNVVVGEKPQKCRLVFISACQHMSDSSERNLTKSSLASSLELEFGLSLGLFQSAVFPRNDFLRQISKSSPLHASHVPSTCVLPMRVV